MPLLRRRRVVRSVRRLRRPLQAWTPRPRRTCGERRLSRHTTSAAMQRATTTQGRDQCRTAAPTTRCAPAPPPAPATSPMYALICPICSCPEWSHPLGPGTDAVHAPLTVFAGTALRHSRSCSMWMRRRRTSPSAGDFARGFRLSSGGCPNFAGRGQAVVLDRSQARRRSATTSPTGDRLSESE